MKVESKKIPCPNCNKTIEITYKSSQYISGFKTDFSNLGACTSTPFYNTCNYCKFVFYDENIKFNKKILNNYIKSNQYISIYKKYIEKNPFYLIYSIYKNQKILQKEINFALLYNYYYTSTISDFELLIDHYIKFLETYTKIDEDFIFTNIMIGEYNRRIGKLNEAKNIFIKIKYIALKFKEEDDNDTSFVKMCDFQLKLIAEGDYSLETYYEKLEPNYTQHIPLLDSYKIFKNEYPDDEDYNPIFYFLCDLHLNHRYSEFKKGLNRLIKMNINLMTSDLPLAILSLFSIKKGMQAKDEILNMFKIALFEYNILDTTFTEDIYVCIGTIIDHFKIGVLWESGRVEPDIVNEVREMILQYVISKYSYKHTFTLQEQHALLLTQFPNFDKVVKLYELNFRFDTNCDYKEYYSDTIDYLISMGECSQFSKYGEYCNKEFEKLYDFLNFLVDNAISQNINKEKLINRIKGLNERLSKQNIENLINKINFKFKNTRFSKA